MMENIDYKALWHSSRLKVTDEFDIPQILIKKGNCNIATIGNFSATIGKAKSKKTFHTSLITASVLINNLIVPYFGSLPKKKRNIIYFDTEQSPYHCKKVIKRIIDLAKLNPKIHPENFDFVYLRKYSPVVRLGIIEEAIKNTKYLGFVIIDGIRDLVMDINSPSESTEIITKLMQWTEDYQIHIHVVLHTNKTDDNARGHLGTELLNKAETVIQVAKDNKNREVSFVKPVAMRDLEFEEFAFTINEEGIPELIEDYETALISNHFSYGDLKEEQHIIALNKVFEEQKSLGYSELLGRLRIAYEVVGLKAGEGKIKQLKTFLENKRMIIKGKDRQYSFNPDFYF